MSTGSPIFLYLCFTPPPSHSKHHHLKIYFPTFLHKMTRAQETETIGKRKQIIPPIRPSCLLAWLLFWQNYIIVFRQKISCRQNSFWIKRFDKNALLYLKVELYKVLSRMKKSIYWFRTRPRKMKDPTHFCQPNHDTNLYIYIPYHHEWETTSFLAALSTLHALLVKRCYHNWKYWLSLVS